MSPIRRFGIAMLFVSVAAGAPAAGETTYEKLTRGQELHDQGRFAEAIALYREVLQSEPDDDAAQYELAHSLGAAGDHAECVEVGERALKKAKMHRAELHASIGNCLDAAGKPKEAVKRYEKGLKEFPDDSNLAYNFALTQFALERYRESRQLLKIALAGRPEHGSSYILLSRLYHLEGYSTHALLAALRFLALEPSSPRSPPMATIARQLLTGSVRQKDATNIEISVAKEPKDEGDLSGASMLVALLAASSLTEKEKSQPEADRLAQLVDALLDHLAEDKALASSPPFVRDHLLKPLIAIQIAGLGEVFGYQAFSSLELAGGQAWLASHGTEQAALLKITRAAASPASP